MIRSTVLAPFVLLLAWPGGLAAQNEPPPGYQNIVDWTRNCSTSGTGLEVDLGFAPVLWTPTGDPGYDWANSPSSYADDAIELAGSDTTVTLVTRVLRVPPGSMASSPDVLWGVIAAPRVVRARDPYEGLLVQPDRAVEYGALTLDSLDELRAHSRLGAQPAFNLAPDPTLQSEVTVAWQSLFGNDVVQDLLVRQLLLKQGGDWGYDFTFYPMPQPVAVGLFGYRWPVRRTIVRRGPVLGLLLQADGRCLASAVMSVR